MSVVILQIDTVAGEAHSFLGILSGGTPSTSYPTSPRPRLPFAPLRFARYPLLPLPLRQSFPEKPSLSSCRPSTARVRTSFVVVIWDPFVASTSHRNWPSLASTDNNNNPVICSDSEIRKSQPPAHSKKRWDPQTANRRLTSPCILSASPPHRTALQRSAAHHIATNCCPVRGENGGQQRPRPKQQLIAKIVKGGGVVLFPYSEPKHNPKVGRRRSKRPRA